MMRNARHDFGLGSGIAAQLVGNDNTRDIPHPLEQLTEELSRRSLIAPGLHEDIEHFALLIDRAPKILQPTVDANEHLIEMPSIAESSATRTNPLAVDRTELQTPFADAFIANHAPALGHHF